MRSLKFSDDDRNSSSFLASTEEYSLVPGTWYRTRTARCTCTVLVPRSTSLDDAFAAKSGGAFVLTHTGTECAWGEAKQQWDR